MRLKALVEIYTMHSFAQLCNLKIKFCQNFAKNFAEFCKTKKKIEKIRNLLANILAIF